MALTLFNMVLSAMLTDAFRTVVLVFLLSGTAVLDKLLYSIEETENASIEG